MMRIYKVYWRKIYNEPAAYLSLWYFGDERKCKLMNITFILYQWLFLIISYYYLC